MDIIKKAAVLVIGDEILSGRTLDTNTQTIAKKLGDVGIRLSEARVIPDDVDTIIQTVHALRGVVDYVFTTGGIGPTHDDKTAAAMAAAFNVPLTRNADAWARLVVHYKGAEHINPGRAKMADIPEGAALIDNPVSAAPGFCLGNVYVMAGVPHIMAAMLDGIVPTLEGGTKLLSRTVSADLAESVLAAGLEAIEGAHEGITIGSYPRYNAGKAAVAIVARGTDPDVLTKAIEEVAALMRTHGGDPVFEG